jgi:hypothetical protein
MTLDFSTASSLNAEFRTDLLVFGTLVVLITVAFELSYRKSPLAMPFRARCLLAVAALAVVVWYAFASSYSHFISLDATSSELRLTFVGPRAREIVVAAEDIVAVTYGLSDRGNTSCRLAIETRSARYYSAWIAGPELCRKRRDDVRELIRR